MDKITFKNGFTQEQAGYIGTSILLMTGPGAEYRLSFVQNLRELQDDKALASEVVLDRTTASCFRTGIMGGCHAQGRTDSQIEVLLRTAKILRIRSWIDLPKVEEHKAEFDTAEDIPFDGDDA